MVATTDLARNEATGGRAQAGPGEAPRHAQFDGAINNKDRRLLHGLAAGYTRVVDATCSSLRRLWALLLVAGSVTFWHGAAMCQPSTLWRHSAIYDPARQRMVVFGGGNDAVGTNNAWQLTLAGDPRWAPLVPVGNLPARRRGHSAVYDPKRDRMLVFGGLDSAGVLADVWALSLADPPTWSNLQPSGPGPSARRYHTAIYDPLRDRMLVFGGSDELGIPFGDVWILWLAPTPRWEQIVPGGTAPLARYSHSAIYDPVRDRMLVFSGGGLATNDVWALSLGDTPAWAQLLPSGSPPLARFAHSAVYDPNGDRMILFGGHDYNQPLNEVWALSLTEPAAWTLVFNSDDAPSPRAYHSAVYDSAYRRMVVFGGFPNVSEPTWVLSLGHPMRWSPARPVVEVSPAALELPTVTVGDTVSVPFLVSNLGLEPLLVTAVFLPDTGMRLSSPAPFQLAWNEAVTETLWLAASSPGPVQDSLVIVSSDPRTPRRQVDLNTDVLGLEFDTRVLNTPDEVPLGVSFIVVVTPELGVRVERGMLYYRIAGASSAFDSLALTPLATDFIAAIPAAAVTELGVEFYVSVENSGFVATQPAAAPTEVFTQPVAPPVSMTAIPRPTSGEEFLTGRDIQVEVVLPTGANFLSGTIRYRQGGEQAYQSGTLSVSGSLGRPVATIPASMVGPCGVEYRVAARTLKNELRFPATDSAPAIIRTKVQNLAEQSEHPGACYRLLTVPLDFGADFSGGLDALLTDQFGTYDPVRWRAYWYDPELPANVEFSSASVARFRPEPGRTFWLISRNAHRVNTAPLEGLSTPTGREYPIALAAGWNLFGNPFDFPVAWSEVRRDPVAVDDPVAFDPLLGTIGDYAEEAPSVLAPFEGYFVHANQAATLWVPPRAAPNPVARSDPRPSGAAPTPATQAARLAAHEDPGDLWRFRVRAWTERAMDGSGVFGVHSSAKPGFDPLDWPKPPPPPEPSVEVAFVHPEWQKKAGLYRRDLRGPGSEGETWEIEVRSSTPGEPITLELSEIVPASSGLALRLIDHEQGTSADGWRASGDPAGSSGTGLDGERSVVRYRIVSFGQRPYRLAIVAGTEEYVERASQQSLAIPARLTLDQIAPNPVRLAARIRFGLPRAGPVSLEIYSVLGQRVAAPIDRAQLPPGYHSVVWEGRASGGEQAPSGVYFLRLVSGGDALTRRIVLVR